MRLKSMNKTNGRNAHKADESNNDLNGSTSSNTSNNGADDLDLDSADDEIDVGTNADSAGYNGSHGGGSSNGNANASSPGFNGDYYQPHSSSSSSQNNNQGGSMINSAEADRKRAHHNALERKRRDHIKDSFHTLRDAIPNIKGEKTSRAQILKAATDYIKSIRTRNTDYQKDIDTLKNQNNEIENQIRQLERAKQAQPNTFKLDSSNSTFNMLNSSGDESMTIKSEMADPSPSLQTIIITKPSSSSSLASNTTTKKFKTIINPKNSLNIINISSSNHNNNNFNANDTIEKDFL